MDIPYRPYCTCFNDEDKVYFYDEVKESIFKSVKATGDEADKIMDEWVANAPRDVICQKL